MTATEALEAVWDLDPFQQLKLSLACGDCVRLQKHAVDRLSLKTPNIPGLMCTWPAAIFFSRHYTDANSSRQVCKRDVRAVSKECDRGGGSNPVKDVTEPAKHGIFYEVHEEKMSKRWDVDGGGGSACDSGQGSGKQIAKEQNLPLR